MDRAFGFVEPWNLLVLHDASVTHAASRFFEAQNRIALRKILNPPRKDSSLNF
jgi:hypothetical protein